MKNDREGFRLGEWQIIPEAGVFVKNGHHVHVEPKLMDLLLALIAAPGQFASREQLLSQVWPRVVINEEVLTRAVSELRTLLGDTSRERRYIVTVPKRGYRLIVQPQEHECDIGKAAAATATNSAPTSRSWPALRMPGWAQAAVRVMHATAMTVGYVFLAATATLTWELADNGTPEVSLAKVVSDKAETLLMLPVQASHDYDSGWLTRRVVSVVTDGHSSLQTLECNAVDEEETHLQYAGERATTVGLYNNKLS